LARRGRHELAEDRQRLELFSSRATMLEQSALVREHVGASMTMSWRQGEPWTWSSTEPAPEILESALVRLRPFLTSGNQVFLFGIYNICQRRLRHDGMRTFLGETRDAWSRSQRQGFFGLKVDERDILPERVADLWLNGFYFHDDPAKRAELESFGGATMLSRHLFLDYIYRAIEATVATASVVKPALEQDLFE
jgi:hypothetical protein